MMNAAQWKLRDHTVTKADLDAYLDACELLTREHYFAAPSAEQTDWKLHGQRLSWSSAVSGVHPENNIAHADLYDASTHDHSQGAPTIILLHALMSANDFGYRRIAAHFNKRGWNALFPHLPYHYSRRPKGYANGALAITTDIIRNAETLRQSVIELRQLMDWSRRRGSQRIALLGTSYGGWVSALTLGLEMTDFTVLIQPIVDVPHATFQSPSSAMMAGLLKTRGINMASISRHAHLTSPMHMTPVTSTDRITVIGGAYDRISPSEALKSLANRWGGTRYQEVRQGHFGYEAMKRALVEAEHYINSPIQ